MSESVTDSPDVWELWRRLKRLFPSWTLAFDGLVTKGSWSLIGVDFVSGLAANRSTERARQLLAGADDAAFDGVSALAAINARRQERIFRVIAILYLTAPLTLLATWGELAPEAAKAYLSERSVLAVGYAFLFSLVVLVYFGSWWRSRQIQDVLDLIRIERTGRPYTALELREE